MGQVLAEVESGTIDIVQHGPVMLLQFNCDCKDALPFCNAMCCRMRMLYNVELDEDEQEKFDHKVVDTTVNSQVVVLQSTPAMDCTYLKGTDCSVQADKPRHCADWHCSPKGNPGDKTITRRQMGWMLMASGMQVKE